MSTKSSKSRVAAAAWDALRLGLMLVPAMTLVRLGVSLHEAALLDPEWLPLIRLLARPMLIDACIAIALLVVVGAWFGRVHVDDVARRLALAVPLVPWIAVMVVHDHLAVAQPVLQSVRYLGHFVMISSLPLALLFGRLTRHRDDDEPTEPWMVASATSAVGGVALVVGLVTAMIPVAAPERAPNLILVTVDTLRADDLGAYGARFPTSPYLDSLAERGIRFERAFSAAPWTLPGLASIHTSVRPSEHGAVLAGRQIPSGQRRLAEVLRNGGYDTIGVVSHFFTSSGYGFARGFGRFDESIPVGHDLITGDQVTAHALSLLGEAPPEPFFLWVHYFDAHYTYLDRDELDWSVPERDGLPAAVSDFFLHDHGNELTDAQALAVRAMYDEEVHRTDAQIEDLLTGVDGLGLSRDVVVAVTGDHGEMFRERGRWGHATWTWREVVHVPLILAGPEERIGQPRVESSTVGTASIAKTLCHIAGLSCGFDGDDLLDVRDDQERVVLSEGNNPWSAAEQTISARTSTGWSIIRGLHDDSIELYDTNRDPAEVVNVAAGHPEVVERLRPLLEPATELFPAVVRKLRPSEVQMLEELGYVDRE